VFLNGDPDYGVSNIIPAHLIAAVLQADSLQVWTAGMCIGLIHDIPTCDELLKRIEREAKEVLQQQMSLWKEDARL